ncbi:hypothetical protein FRC02_009319 [Tulasnella sp. 418]|nr:hypothetical protein FRC02_009319 [Tulasnella sp. 418]
MLKSAVILISLPVFAQTVAGAVYPRQATSTGTSSAPATTCPNSYPLQTSWKFIPAPRNSVDFGPPNPPQGKAANGQPKPGGQYGSQRPRNLILIIPDGFGPASETLARDYVQWKNTEKGWNYELPADQLLVGTVRTRASDSYVTDSAAGATAYSCAIKSYNGAIAVDEDGNPCGTVLEAAKAAGFKTGLVVTSRITHATPAAFASHIYDRDAEDKIAVQLAGGTPLGRVVDIMLGGGLGFFLPNSTTGSSRKDNIDVLQQARNNGFTVLSNRTAFDALQGGNAPTAGKPYLGLFARSHMSFEIDRVAAEQPSLLEMTKTSIRSLERMTKGQQKGFFLMVEASRIDHAGHSNDAIGHVHDILHFNEVVGYLKSYVDQHPDTTFIGVADHETGGLTLGGINELGEYQWNPEALDKGRHSCEYLAAAWKASNSTDPTEIFAQYGITDANATEISVALELRGNTVEMEHHIGQSFSRRALLKWTTGGHSAVDVNLIAHGRNSGRLRGNYDNTEVGQFITDQLGLDLPAITSKLNNPKNEKWLIEQVGRDSIENGVRNTKRKRSLDHHHCH